MTHAEHFEAHRDLLFTIAYELTGSAAEAEDAVQDTWLRWADVDLDEIGHPRAYLCRIVSRAALNRLRALARRREDYPGPWLPEPVATTPDLLDDAVLAESVSEAMLIVLDTLGPVERAVFVLHEVFGFPAGELAELLARSPDAIRQIASRARARVRDRRPNPRAMASSELADRLTVAIRSGDVDTVRDLLTDDVVLTSDGGGKATAARVPVRGPDHVARFLVGIGGVPFAAIPRHVGGEPAVLVSTPDGDRSVIRLATRDGRVEAITIVRNPDKLTAVDAPRRLRRR